MAKNIADLQVTIGADGSQLKNELNKAQQQISKSFNVNPITAFSDSIEGVTGKLSGMVNSITKIAGIAATGFGLTSIVSGAVQAGESVYQLTQRYQMSNAEAVQMSRIMKVTGNDVDSAAKSIMRLDKSYQGTGESSKKAQSTLAAYNVSLTDSNGKLLPLNQQLANLAKGYQEAAKEGNGQAFIMNTLGARGLSLVSTLQNYNEAAQVASKIKGIGLDPQAMHEADLQMKTMDLEFGQLKIAAGAAFAPLVSQILPTLLPMLQQSAEWISKNKNEIVSTATDLTELVAIYEALNIAQKAYHAVSNVVSSVSNVGETAQAVELSKTQQREINKTVAASDKLYAQMRKDAISTAQQQNMSAEETREYLTQRFTEIGLAASQAAETIRAQMTEKFLQVRTAAAETSAQVNESLLSTGEAAAESAVMHETANADKVVSNESVIASNTIVGDTALLAGQKAAEGAAVAEGGVLAESASVIGLAGTHVAAGGKAVEAGAKTLSASSKAIGIVKNFTSTVWALAGGWLGVAAAIGYAITKYLDYEDEAKRRNDTQVEHGNGVYLTQDKDGNIIQRERVGGPNSRTTTEWHDASDENKAWFQNNLDYEKNYKELTQGGDNFEKIAAEMDRLKSQFATGGLDENGNSIKSPKSAKTRDNSTAMQALEFLINQGYSPEVAAGVVGNLMQESGGGTENLAPTAQNDSSGAFGIAQWTGDRKQALFDFAAQNGQSAYDFSTQLAFLVEEMRTSHAGAMGNVVGAQSASEAADLFNQYYEVSGDSSEPRMENAESIFGKYQSGNTGNNAEKILQMQKRIDDAKKSLAELEAQLTTSIAGTSATTYEADMSKLDEDVKKKADAIAKIKQVSTSIDTKPAEDLLQKYKEVNVSKITDEWRERWQKLKTDTAKIDSDIYGSFKGLADAEYQTTVDSLNKEYKERLKAVQQSKDDAVAKAAVDKWYTDSITQAVQKRTQAFRDAYDKQVQYSINTHDATGLQNLLGSDDAKENAQWNARTKALTTYKDVMVDANKTITESVADAASSFNGGLANIFTNLGSEINSVGDLTKNIGNLILSTIASIVAKMAAARITNSIFGDYLLGTTYSGAQTSAMERMYNSLGSYNLSGSSSSGFNFVSSYQPFVGSGYNTFDHFKLFASGGVVTAPTYSLIGEGGDSEAVLPLNTGTYQSLAKNISANIGNQSSGTKININNYGSDKVTAQSDGFDDTGAESINVTIGELQKNTNGSLDALKQLLGGR